MFSFPQWGFLSGKVSGSKEGEEDKKKTRTLAHIGRAADLARVLRSVRVDPPPELEESVRVELGRVGDDFVKHIGHAIVLCGSPHSTVVSQTLVGEEGRVTRRTSRMVLM